MKGWKKLLNSTNSPVLFCSPYFHFTSATSIPVGIIMLVNGFYHIIKIGKGEKLVSLHQMPRFSQNDLVTSFSMRHRMPLKIRILKNQKLDNSINDLPSTLLVLLSCFMDSRRPWMNSWLWSSSAQSGPPTTRELPHCGQWEPSIGGPREGINWLLWLTVPSRWR